MFVSSLKIKIFFKKSWHDCEQYGKDKYKKKEHHQHGSLFKVLT